MGRRRFGRGSVHWVQFRSVGGQLAFIWVGGGLGPDQSAPRWDCARFRARVNQHAAVRVYRAQASEPRGGALSWVQSDLFVVYLLLTTLI